MPRVGDVHNVWAKLLGPSLIGDRDPLLARQLAPGCRRVNLGDEAVLGVWGIGFRRQFDGRRAGDQEFKLCDRLGRELSIDVLGA
jgi:hypothetical protein